MLTAASVRKIGANGGTSGSTVPEGDAGLPDNQPSIRPISPRDASASAATEDPSIDCALAAQSAVPSARQTRAHASRGPEVPSSSDEVVRLRLFFAVSRAINLSLSAR